MSGFSAIDLTKLNAPDLIEPLDFEQIFQAMLADLQTRSPEFSALVESDPAIKVLQVAAYRELLLRARINDACKGVMLAFAKGDDLDHLSALFGVTRQLLDEGDENAIPSISPTYESDERLRKRTQLSLEGHSTAGPVGSYVFHALAASGDVKDVDVTSPKAGEVEVTVLSTKGQGIPDNALIEVVDERLNSKTVRPLTDKVGVKKAQVITYEVSATLILYEGPDSDVVKKKAINQLNEFVERHHLLGHDIRLSGLYAALHQEGVQRVILHAPANDLVLAYHQAGWCQRTNVSIGGRDE